MSIKALTVVGIAALSLATPAAAQRRGSIEFGAFGSAATFDNNLSLTTAYGGGGRVGAYLSHRFSLEFEDAEMRSNRPNGLTAVNVGILSGRLVAVPVHEGALSLLVGAGAGVSTETNFLHSYGVDGLVGAKYSMTENTALRVDGVWDWLANQNWKQYKSIRVGLSVYRHAARMNRAESIITPYPRTPEHEDSVSAAETRRLRDRDAALDALRDSLRNAPAPMAAPSAAAVATMNARIHFAFDKSVLTDSAKAILDEKVEVFRANPGLSIVIQGYTDVVGSDKYNMALGGRRAEAAKDYIVSRGIAPNRVIIESEGERRQIPNTPGVAGEAPNRRAVFRLLIAPDTLVKP